MPDHDDILWSNLLTWLESKGLRRDEDLNGLGTQRRQGAGKGLFASQELKADQCVLRIPNSAMMNTKTLRNTYPNIPLEGISRSSSEHLLTGTQLLSMHLALNRPKSEEYSQDLQFGPYIDVFPREFDAHPLTWLIKREKGTSSPREDFLLRCLPPSVNSSLDKIALRLEDDWKSVIRCLEFCNSELENALEYANFVWGWLVVNTRCLHYQLFNEDLPLTNLTLCPIIDFANHTTDSSLPHLQPAPQASLSERQPRSPRQKHFTFLSSGSVNSSGVELFLRYGGHSNKTLFVEYGFIDERADPSLIEVDVADVVESLMDKRGTMGDGLRRILEEERFLGDWFLYAVPAPAHPSWRLLMTLRLLNSLHSVEVDGRDIEAQLSPWRRVVQGEVEIISEMNEAKTRKDLEEICEVVMGRSKAILAELREGQTKYMDGDMGSWFHFSARNVIGLLQEEYEIADAVLNSVKTGCEF